MPCSRCHAKLGLARPVAAEPDLQVALAGDVAVADQPVHRGSVRQLDAEDLGPGVRVRVEVDEPDRPVDGGDGADVRLGDRVVAAEDDRDRAGRHDLADGALDLRVRLDGVGGETAASPKSTTRSSANASILASRCGPGRAARSADRARAESRPGPVGDEVVRRSADDRHVDTRQLGRILCVRHPA